MPPSIQEKTAAEATATKIMHKRFFCLRGHMKSGTNWLNHLLNSHDQINCLGEFHWHEIFSRYIDTNSLTPIFGDGAYLEKARVHIEQMIRNCMTDAAEPDALVIGDRTPHSIEPITLRDAPHICIIRDGRDVLVSRIFHLYNNPDVALIFDRVPELAKTLAEFKNDPWYFKKNPSLLLRPESMIRDSIRIWRDHVRRDASSVERNPQLKVHLVRYEDLHRDTKAERTKVFEFLDVDPKLAGKIRKQLKASFKKERPNEFLRKGIVGDWQNYFTDENKAWFKEEASEELMRFDYTDSLDW